MSKGFEEGPLALAFLCVVVSLIVGGFLVSASNERDTFNKFRREGQPEATLKDALFSELRITN